MNSFIHHNHFLGVWHYRIAVDRMDSSNMISVGRHAFEIFRTSSALSDSLASVYPHVVLHVTCCVKSHVTSIKCTKNILLIVMFLHVNNQCCLDIEAFPTNVTKIVFWWALITVVHLHVLAKTTPFQLFPTDITGSWCIVSVPLLVIYENLLFCETFTTCRTLQDTWMVQVNVSFECPFRSQPFGALGATEVLFLCWLYISMKHFDMFGQTFAPHFLPTFFTGG